MTDDSPDRGSQGSPYFARVTLCHGKLTGNTHVQL